MPKIYVVLNKKLFLKKIIGFNIQVLYIGFKKLPKIVELAVDHLEGTGAVILLLHHGGHHVALPAPNLVLHCVVAQTDRIKAYLHKQKFGKIICFYAIHK